MRSRILVALLLTPLLLALLYLAPGWVFVLVLMAASALCLTEFMTAFEKKLTAACVHDIVFAAFLILCVWCGFDLPILLGGGFLFLLALCANALADFPGKSPVRMCVHFFAAVCLPLSLSALLYVYRLPIGRELILLPFLAAFGTDICALFSGMMLGRHKLAPQISPQKTVEGAVGGLLGALLLSAVYLALMPLLSGTSIRLSFPLMLGILAVSSMTAQMGDLTFSLCKRAFGVKDFGRLLPGHGGLLDRVDSLMLAAPAFAFLYLFLPDAAVLSS